MKLSPSDGSRGAGQKLNCTRHQHVVRAALMSAHSHGQTNTTNMKFDQTVLLRKRHLGKMSDILRQQHCPYTKKHLGQQTHHVSSVQIAQMQRIVSKTTTNLVGSNRNSPGRLSQPSLPTLLICRDTIETRAAVQK